MRQGTNNTKDVEPTCVSRRGQSLIEAMVAMTVLTVVFLGISSLLSQSLALTRVTTNQLTATYLASEGIEIVKNMIDHDQWGGSSWGNFLSDNELQPFVVDYTTGYDFDESGCNPATNCESLVSFDSLSSAQQFLSYSSSTGLYGYLGLYGYNPPDATPTDFARKIWITPSDLGSSTLQEMTVISTVSWIGNNGFTQNVTLEDHFYNWYANPNATPSP